VGLVSQVWDTITSVFNWGYNLVTGQNSTFAQSLSGTWGAVVKAAKWLADTVSLSFTVLGYVMSNWREGIDLVMTNATLAVVRFGNQAEWVFADAIPAALGFLYRQSGNILRDIASLYMTVWGNIAGNVVNVLKNLPALIKGQVNFADLWTPITEGFQSAITEAFVLPDRVKGQWEKELEDQSNVLGDAYSKGMSDAINKTGDQARKATDAIGKGMSEAMKPPTSVQAPKVDPPKVPDLNLKAKVNPETLAMTVTPEIRLAKAVRVGSAEAAMLRLAGGAGGAMAIPAAIRPPAPPPPPTAAAAAAAAAAGATAGGATGDWWRDQMREQLNELKKNGGYLDRIERNTRAGNGGVNLQVVSF